MNDREVVRLLDVKRLAVEDRLVGSGVGGCPREGDRIDFADRQRAPRGVDSVNAAETNDAVTMDVEDLGIAFKIEEHAEAFDHGVEDAVTGGKVAPDPDLGLLGFIQRQVLGIDDDDGFEDPEGVDIAVSPVGGGARGVRERAACGGGVRIEGVVEVADGERFLEAAVAVVVGRLERNAGGIGLSPIGFVDLQREAIGAGTGEDHFPRTAF